jgi:hypothetical protein
LNNGREAQETDESQKIEGREKNQERQEQGGRQYSQAADITARQSGAAADQRRIRARG